jgi:A/G-specific adenine glycosylase
VTSGAVLAWGMPRLRDLPWRRTRDPWSILVAETMLQQTQVPRVVERYGEFLLQFPTTAACAVATAGDVVRAWAGLGYNRRALSLHGAATAIEHELGGVWPREVAGLRRLPGVGPYTARAVLAFAFELPAAVVDTNVARVLARRGGTSLTPAAVQAAADALALDEDPWTWNQVLLDLGATVCTARRPRCDECPLAATGHCRWFAAGRPEPDPAIGSAGVSGGQSRFDGSDRQGRGRLVQAMRTTPVAVQHLAEVMGWPGDAERATRVAATLVRDGMAVIDAGTYRLP